jgi:hypothetical protein
MLSRIILALSFFAIQWKPLNVIKYNVIIESMLSHYERPGLFIQTNNNKICFL